MDAKDYWTIFMETGLPEAYMLYAKQLKMEEGNAPDDPSPRPAGYGLQRS